MMMTARAALWTPEELIAATRGRLEGAAPADLVTGISSDSRQCEAGDLFIALKGPHHDGHAHIAAAFEAGAVLALAARRPDNLVPDAPLLLVEDTMTALEDLGRSGRLRAGGKVIGITGSVGKTSTKEALRVAFSALAPSFANPGSLNNHWGVPLSLAQFPPEASYGIFEMGMNAPNEIARLTRMVRPHLAIITAIAPSHIGGFTNLAEIADAKTEIFQSMTPDDCALLPRDSDYCGHLLAAARTAGLGRIYSFGQHEDADARLISCIDHPAGARVSYSIMGQRLDLDLALHGVHLATNLAAVLLAVAVLGGDVLQAGKALATLSPVKGRGQRIKTSWGLVIDESYNASPASMRAALHVLAGVQSAKRRVALLGDMLELGTESRTLHEAIAEDLAGVDLVHCCGEMMQHLHAALPENKRGIWAEDSATLAAHLPDLIRDGDAVMIKGSAGSRMGVVLQAAQALQSVESGEVDHVL